MKTCNTCKQEKDDSEYYARNSTCKPCFRLRVRAREIRLRETDPAWAEKEAARHRMKTRKYVAEGRVKPIDATRKKDAMARYFRGHPNRKKAHSAVSNAIRDGRIQRLPCAVCSSKTTEAHHDDYDKPLDVLWLCKKHHMERHVLLNQQSRLMKASRANVGEGSR